MFHVKHSLVDTSEAGEQLSYSSVRLSTNSHIRGGGGILAIPDYFRDIICGV